MLRTVGDHDLTYSRNTLADTGHFWGSQGSDPAQVNDLVKYMWGNHSNRPVPVYFQGEGSQVLLDSVGQGYTARGASVPGIPGSVDEVHAGLTRLQALEAVLEPSTIGGLVALGVRGFFARRKR